MRLHTSAGKSPAPALDPQEADDEQPDVLPASRMVSADVELSRLSSETKFPIGCSWARPVPIRIPLSSRVPEANYQILNNYLLRPQPRHCRGSDKMSQVRQQM